VVGLRSVRGCPVEHFDVHDLLARDVEDQVARPRGFEDDVSMSGPVGASGRCLCVEALAEIVATSALLDDVCILPEVC
jgi:hypothetical protein